MGGRTNVKLGSYKRKISNIGWFLLCVRLTTDFCTPVYNIYNIVVPPLCLHKGGNSIQSQ